jgi:hypothetical protein
MAAQLLLAMVSLALLAIVVWMWLTMALVPPLLVP